MKLLIIVLTFILNPVFSADDKKVYTEKEMQTKVREEVSKKIDQIKKKSITQLTKELLAKEEELLKRQEELERRAEQLKINEDSLIKKIAEFEKQKEKVIGCIDDNRKNEMLRIKQLVSVIAGMKPAKAAELLSVQDSNISVKILEKIDPGKASKIFNLMDKEVSARLQKQYLNMQK
ncbi:MAG: hypothetical protein CME62_14535 [Halobacteriovoraceae bacterium]|nr:hypothetical protein [Halobacteriovoraceae bacterium]|tara:strand:- start:1667 stop:2197 length:531 start_codon:yes stop_codon:yes gene_type:complete